MTRPTDYFSVVLAVVDGQGGSALLQIDPGQCTAATALAIARAELANNPWATGARVVGPAEPGQPTSITR